MNARPPSGYTPDYDAHGYDSYSQDSYRTVGTTYADDATGTYAYIPPQPDPFGQMQAQQTQQFQMQQPQVPAQGYGYGPEGYTTGYEQPAAQSYGTGYETTTYGTGTYDTGTYDTGVIGAVGYDATAYETGSHATYDPYAYGNSGYYDTGTYDTSALWQAEPPTAQAAQAVQTPADQSQQPQQSAAGYPQQDWDSGAYPAYGYGYSYGYGYDASGDTGVFEQVPPAYESHGTYEPRQTPEPVRTPEPAAAYDLDPDPALDDVFTTTALATDDVPVRHDYAGDDLAGHGEPVARSRRRKPAKRSALLTVAVPSVAVMGVAAVGAAAVAGVDMAHDSSSTRADGQASAKAPTTQLDRQLAGVSRDADDFATRASRTQERIDLKDRQEAAKKAKAEAAARKEALRPKFLLPVKQKGLSAYFGQAGVNWMALHTGIDFPVQVGTPVMAATDGTVRTQWNSSYGNMAIVTAPDGTETWYCHLSSTKIRSGKVKAGEVIAYSGNTGNTTGPHMHFEVRPNGGAPIDPLPWLLAHGLDPR